MQVFRGMVPLRHAGLVSILGATAQRHKGIVNCRIYYKLYRDQNVFSTGPKPANTKSTENQLDEGESLVSQTVKAIQAANGAPKTSSFEPADANANATVAVPTKMSIMQRVKEGALHYWHGSKLFCYELKISSKLVWKLLHGAKLLRREQRQLLRTSSDIIRLVPFTVFLIVPFLELLLPLFLKFFPNMLPSTFEDRIAAEEKSRRRLKVKLEMAKFLQDTIESMGADSASPDASAAQELAALSRKCRTTGEPLNTADLIKVCKQFGDTLTLDNLPRPQLVSMCRYMGIRAFGTDTYLRYQIRNVMKNLKRDDVMIKTEGIDSLTLEELRAACQARGIKVIGVSANVLKRELHEWLNLHLGAEIPSNLLILSRALSLHVPGTPEQALQVAIASLPEHVVEEAELHATEVAGGPVTFQQKRQVLEQQQEMIEDELAQEQKEARQRETGPESLSAKQALSKKELEQFGEALSVLTGGSPAEREKQELDELRQERAEYKEDTEELRQLSLDKMTTTKGAALLGEQLERLIGKIDTELRQYEMDVGDKLYLIKPGADGQLTIEQLEMVVNVLTNKAQNAERIKEIVRRFDADGDGKVFIDDILELARKVEEEEGQGVIFSETEDEKGERHER